MNRKTLQQLAIVNNLSARKKNKWNKLLKQWSNEIKSGDRLTSNNSLKFICTLLLLLLYGQHGQRFFSLFLSCYTVFIIGVDLNLEHCASYKWSGIYL